MDSVNEATDFFEIIESIQEHVKNNKPLYNKYSEFKNNYPKLFAMLCDTNCDQDMITKLIQIKRKVKSGYINQKEADIEFGQVAVDKYVRPLT